MAAVLEDDAPPTPVVRFPHVYDAAVFTQKYMGTLLSDNGSRAHAVAKKLGVDRGLMLRGRSSTMPPFPCVWDMDDTLVLNTDSWGIKPRREVEGAIVAPLAPIVNLLKELIQTHGTLLAHHIVSARLDAPDIHRYTMDQLVVAGVPAASIASIRLAPTEVRGNYADISVWKDEQRRAIAAESGRPVLLCVGDLITDLVRCSTVSGVQRMKDRLVDPTQPWAILRLAVPHAMYGLLLSGVSP